MHSDPCPACGSAPPPGAAVCPLCGASLAAGGDGLPAGTRLHAGKYSVGRVLGQGGFGITYQGANVPLRQGVAIKEFYPQGTTRSGTRAVPPGGTNRADQEAAKGKFLEEARVLARFNHPYIVRVFDVFEENATAYMVMEFLEGKSLGNRIEAQGPLPPELVLRHAEHLLLALEAVHGAGVLHRDIKPDNVVVAGLGRSDRAVLIDFGAAREFASEAARRHSLVLTPGYAPLEQYATTARRGPFTDLYALGGTLYHALAGSPPPPSTDRASGVPLPPLPAGVVERAPGLARAVMAALEMRVEARPQSAQAFAELMRGEAGAAPRRAGPAPEPAPPPAAARPAASAGGFGSSSARPPAGPPTTPAAGSRLVTAPPLPGPPTAPPLPLALTGSGKARAVAFSPDGATLAVGYDRGLVGLWGVAPGAPVARLTGVAGRVYAVAWSPFGDRLASGGSDRAVTVWDPAAGRAVAGLGGHPGDVTALAYAPDGRTLALGGSDGTVRVWDLASELEGAVMTGHGRGVTALAYGPGGRLASGSLDGTVRLWDAAAARAVGSLGGGGRVYALAWSPQTGRLAAGLEDGSVRLWDADGREAGRLASHDDFVAALAFGPGGRLLVTGSADRTVGLWNAATGDPVARLADHEGWVTSVAVSPDGRHLASSSTDETVNLWSL